MDNEEVKAQKPDNNNPEFEQDGASDQASQASQMADDRDLGGADEADEQASQDSPPAETEQDGTSLVCYGQLNWLGEFSRPRGTKFTIGTKVIVRTGRGIELGRIILGYCEGCGDRGVGREKWQKYLEEGGKGESIPGKGRILRAATDQDLIDQRHLDENATQKLDFCQKLADEMSLEMKVVDVEHLFGGDRIIFYFKSEQRVDFRKLVRRLAKEYQTRIEMRQVGARDEARLLADYERCGRECCCRSFLKQLAPVNMKMAKVQKATLDPAKISGRCGRLMCCLRYEHYNYEELRKKLPPRNALVETPEGEGLVVDRQILTQLVMVRLADARRVAYPLSEITVISAQGLQAVSKQNKCSDEQKKQEGGQDSELSASDSESQQDGPKKRRRKKKRRKSNRPKQ